MSFFPLHGYFHNTMDDCMVFYILEETHKDKDKDKDKDKETQYRYKGFVGYGDYWDPTKDTEERALSLAGTQYVHGDMREVEFTYDPHTDTVYWISHWWSAFQNKEQKRLNALGITFMSETDMGPNSVTYIQYPRSKDGLPIARLMHYLLQKPVCVYLD